MAFSFQIKEEERPIQIGELTMILYFAGGPNEFKRMLKDKIKENQGRLTSFWSITTGPEKPEFTTLKGDYNANSNVERTGD